MKVFIGSDHRGFALKEKLVQKLKESGYAVEDEGNTVLNPQDDYVDFAYSVARKVAADSFSKGVLLCGSGVGVGITANKVKGIRSALVFDEKLAKEARNDDDANVISLPADMLDEEKAWQIVKTFLNTPFSNEERHIRRINKITQIENNG